MIEYKQKCFLRTDKEVHTGTENIFLKLLELGYKPAYPNNYEGKNISLEGNTFHYTDSDNKSGSIDCGTNEDLFLAIASLRDDTNYNQWFCDDQDHWCIHKLHPEYDWMIDESWHKASVEELINHFKIL